MPHFCFSPATLGSLDVPNRLVFSAMTMGFCDAAGRATPPLTQFHLTRVKGGVGLTILEGAAVRRDGQRFAGQLGLWDDNQIRGVAELVRALHERGGKVVAQLTHAGRDARHDLTGLPVFGPVAGWRNGAPLRAASECQLAQLAEDFAKAASRAMEAGVDAIEINGGHGQLLQQFHSRATNSRQDAFGGSPAGRTRLTVAVLEAVRRAMGSGAPLIMQLGVHERLPDGLTLDESLLLGKPLAALVDALHVTAGHPDTPQWLAPSWSEPAHLCAERARSVRKAFALPVIAGGHIRSLAEAECLLTDEQADFAALGRSLVSDAMLPRKTATGFGHRVRICIGCDSCVDRLLDDVPVSCAVNPFVGREADEHLFYPSERPLHVVVAGGGPSGLAAACALRHKGHRVTLLEKTGRLGGRLRGTARGAHGRDLEAYADYMGLRAAEMGVDIRCHQEAVPLLLERLRPHAVVAAVGALPHVPDLPGLAQTPYRLAGEVQRHGLTELPPKAAIIGANLEGCELATWLAQRGCQVTLIDQKPLLAGDAGTRNRALFREAFDELGVACCLHTRVMQAGPRTLTLEDTGSGSGHDRELTDYGLLLLACGYRPNPALRQALNKRGLSVVEAGDCARPGPLLEAIASGVDVIHVL